jgi:hypothetical protein
VSSAFDGFGELALMFCTGSGLPAGSNFPFISDKTTHCLSLFVINFGAGISTELANPWTGIISSPLLWSSLICHNRKLLLQIRTYLQKSLNIWIVI